MKRVVTYSGTRLTLAFSRECRIRGMKNLRDICTSSSMTHGKRSPKAHHWSERIVRQIETHWMKWEGREMLCVHACNGWEQCRNVLQSFGECHNVTWPICVPARIRAESRTLAWPPLRRKGHPSIVATMQLSRCIGAKRTDRKRPNRSLITARYKWTRWQKD